MFFVVDSFKNSHRQIYMSLKILFVFLVKPFLFIIQMSMAANMANTLENVPIECTPEKMSFFESLKSGFTIRDKCKEYYQNKHVNPWAEVPPTRVSINGNMVFFHAEVFSTDGSYIS